MQINFNKKEKKMRFDMLCPLGYVQLQLAEHLARDVLNK